MSRQLSLFEAENAITASIAGFDAVLKAALNRAVAASPYKRAHLVDRINALIRPAGVRLTQGNAKTISLDTLEKWLNPESDQVPTTRAVHVIMIACGSVEPLAAWAGLLGGGIMTAKDKRLRDLAEKNLTIKRAAKEAKRLEQQIEEDLK